MNKTYEISVGEPWDFDGPDGPNKIIAVGEGIVSGPNQLNWGKEYFLLKVRTPFKMDGELVSLLIASPRYEGDSLNKLISEGCTAGIARVREGHNIESGNKIEPDQVKYCIIGTVKLVEP
jgi:hypothetical protein